MQKCHSRSLATKAKSGMAIVRGVEKVKILGCAPGKLGLRITWRRESGLRNGPRSLGFHEGEPAVMRSVPLGPAPPSACGG